MSGGSHNYLCFKIDEMANDHRLTAGSPLRRAFAKHLSLVAEAAHEIEWVDSSDKSPGDEDAAIRAVLGEHAELAELIRMGSEIETALAVAVNRATAALNH